MSGTNTNILIFDDQFKLLVVKEGDTFKIPTFDIPTDDTNKNSFRTQLIDLVRGKLREAAASTGATASASASVVPASTSTAAAELTKQFTKEINAIKDDEIKIDSISLFLHLKSNLSNPLNNIFKFLDVLDTRTSDGVIISKDKGILPENLINDSFRSFLKGFGFSSRPSPANPPAPAPAKNDNDDVVLVRRTRRLSPLSFLSFRSPLLIPSPVVNYSPNRIGNYLSSQSSESNLFPALPRSPRGTSPKSPRMGRKRGGFYEKYMKYKAKYIALKKQLS